MKKKTIVKVIIFLFVTLFLYTGVSKLTDYSTFKEQIALSPLLAPIAKPVAAWMPWLEFLAITLLIIPRWRLKGLYICFILMILYTGYFIAIRSINEFLPCSCGGILSELSWAEHVLLNSLFIALSVAGIILELKIKRGTIIQQA